MRIIDFVFGLILGIALSISAAFIFPRQVAMIIREHPAPELLTGIATVTLVIVTFLLARATKQLDVMSVPQPPQPEVGVVDARRAPVNQLITKLNRGVADRAKVRSSSASDRFSRSD
jgi:hypothetical protein